MNSVVSPAQPARNLGLTLDDQLTVAVNITATAHSYRFILRNIRRMRGSRFFLLCLNYCNSVLVGLYHVASNLCSLARMWSVTLPNSPTLPLLTSLCWLSVAAWIESETLIPCCEWLRLIVHPGLCQTVHHSYALPCHLACYSLNSIGPRLPLNKITTVCCPGSTMVKWAPS